MNGNEGVQEVKASTKKHIRRKLMTELGNVIHIISDDEGKLLVYPDNLTLGKVILENKTLHEKLEKLQQSESDMDAIVQRTAQHLRQDIQEQEVQTTWPPLPADLRNSSLYLVGSTKLFLKQLIGGHQDSSLLSLRVQRFVDSVGQDLVYGVTCGETTPRKRILLCNNGAD